jgi:hypothetical protein
MYIDIHFDVHLQIVGILLFFRQLAFQKLSSWRLQIFRVLWCMHEVTINQISYRSCICMHVLHARENRDLGEFADFL